MSAYVIADITPINPEKLKEYSAQAGATLENFNGKFIAKGEISSFTNDEHHKMKIIIEFPDTDSAEKWYQSDEYQTLIPLRETAMKANFHLIK